MGEINRKKRGYVLHYIKQKRSQNDYCNICGKYKKLTWDHVPPKSVRIAQGDYANTLFAEGIPTKNKHMKDFQNGVKYRNICAECNGDILGKYDTVYADFIRKVNDCLERLTQEVLAEKIINPGTQLIKVDVQINRILRSVIGHFLAMKSVYDKSTVIDNYLRVYLQDEKMQLSDINIFSWFYPYITIVNVRDVAIRDYSEIHPRGLVSVMNSFPLAYLLSTEEEDFCGVDSLSVYSTKEIDEVVTVELHLETAYYPIVIGEISKNAGRKRKDFLWPVNVSDEADGAKFVLGTDQLMESSIVAVPNERDV